MWVPCDPTCVSSDPDIKSEELLWVCAGSTFIIHWYSFIIFWLFQPFISSSPAKTLRKRFLSVRIWRYIRLLSKGDVGITLR